MATYSVVLLFGQKDNVFLYKIIEHLAKKYDAPTFLPHITIYTVVDTPLSVIKEAVKDNMKNISSFTVKGSKLNHSDNIWKTVFVEIEPNPKLSLINKILSQRLAKYTGYDFQPHISLIYKRLSESERKNIIKETPINREFAIDHISVLKSSNDVHRWKYVTSFSL